MQELDHWNGELPRWREEPLEYDIYLLCDRETGDVFVEVVCDPCGAGVAWDIEVYIVGELADMREFRGSEDMPGQFAFDAQADPGESVTAVFSVQTTGGLVQFYLFGYRRALVVDSLDATASGNDVDVAATVDNPATASADGRMQLWVDGTDYGMRDVSVPAGSSEVVEFTIFGFAEGEHEICAEIV